MEREREREREREHYRQCKYRKGEGERVRQIYGHGGRDREEGRKCGGRNPSEILLVHVLVACPIVH